MAIRALELVAVLATHIRGHHDPFHHEVVALPAVLPDVDLPHVLNRDTELEILGVLRFLRAFGASKPQSRK